MDNYKNVKLMINEIKALNEKEVLKSIELDIDQNQTNNLHALYFFIAHCLLLATSILMLDGFTITNIILTFFSFITVAPLIFTITYGTLLSLTRPFPNFNVLKSIRLEREYKKLGIVNLIKKNNFENESLISFLKKFDINVEQFKFISDDEMNEVTEKINLMPNFIKVKVKERMLKLMIEGRKFRQKDKQIIEQIFEKSETIKTMQRKNTQMIEDFYNDIEKDKEKEDIDGLILTVKSSINTNTH